MPTFYNVDGNGSLMMSNNMQKCIIDVATSKKECDFLFNVSTGEQSTLKFIYFQTMIVLCFKKILGCAIHHLQLSCLHFYILFTCFMSKNVTNSNSVLAVSV